jgi:hypothetical protein
LDLINYAIGEHEILVVDKNNKQLVSSKFSVITNYPDTRNIVARLFTKNHIKNLGIATSIIARLYIAELLDQFRLKKLKNVVLDELKLFVLQQSSGKKSKIDAYASRILIENIDYLRN